MGPKQPALTVTAATSAATLIPACAGAPESCAWLTYSSGVHPNREACVLSPRGPPQTAPQRSSYLTCPSSTGVAQSFGDFTQVLGPRAAAHTHGQKSSHTPSVPRLRLRFEEPAVMRQRGRGHSRVRNLLRCRPSEGTSTHPTANKTCKVTSRARGLHQEPREPNEASPLIERELPLIARCAVILFPAKKERP